MDALSYVLDIGYVGTSNQDVTEVASFFLFIQSNYKMQFPIIIKNPK